MRSMTQQKRKEDQMNRHIILLDWKNGNKFALFIEDIVYISREEDYTKIDTLSGKSNEVYYCTTESVESLVARINKILSGHD